MFTPLSKLIPHALRSVGISREAEAARICARYRRIAPRLVHEEALLHTVAKHYRGKTLTIGVTNSAWAAQVLDNKEALLKALNEGLGRDLVAQLKTVMVEKIP